MILLVPQLSIDVPITHESKIRFASEEVKVSVTLDNSDRYITEFPVTYYLGLCYAESEPEILATLYTGFLSKGLNADEWIWKIHELGQSIKTHINYCIVAKSLDIRFRDSIIGTSAIFPLTNLEIPECDSSQRSTAVLRSQFYQDLYVSWLI